MGLTVIDAGVMIGLLDVRDGHHGAALEALSSAATSGDVVAMSASAVAELLVVPARKGGGRLHDQMLVDAVLGFCREYPVEIVAVGVEIATQAARLRAIPAPGCACPMHWWWPLRWCARQMHWSQRIDVGRRQNTWVWPEGCWFSRRKVGAGAWRDPSPKVQPFTARVHTRA